MVAEVLGSLNHVGLEPVEIDCFLTESRCDMMKRMDKQYLKTGLSIGVVMGLFGYATLDSVAAASSVMGGFTALMPAIGRDNARYPLDIEYTRLTFAAQYGVKK